MRWFAAHIDRCFETLMYGDGVRIYSDSITNINGYFIPKSYFYDNGILNVRGVSSTYTTENLEYLIQVENEPDLDEFNVYHKFWKSWDEKFGKSMGEDRSDYEPYPIKTIEELLSDLKREE